MSNDNPQPPPPPQPPQAAQSADVRSRILAIRGEVGKIVVGQEGAVSAMLIALLVGGHVLVEGVPGVGKTLLVKAMSRAVSLDFNRVQFTPDLMPTDVTGQLVFDAGESGFEFRPGPVFTNFLLADEINRTPPKTQAALLEAMEESQVSVGGTTYRLPEPFITIATQNPVEYEGTYPLPEAQLDRFAIKIIMEYPSEQQEFEVVARHHRGLDPHRVETAGLTAVATGADIAAARRQIEQVRVEDNVLAYIVSVCRATRASASVAMGVSPRGATALLYATKAWTWLSGKEFATPDEVQAVAPAVLRHRLLLRPELELDGLKADQVITSVLASVPTPR